MYREMDMRYWPEQAEAAMRARTWPGFEFLGEVWQTKRVSGCCVR